VLTEYQVSQLSLEEEGLFSDAEESPELEELVVLLNVVLDLELFEEANRRLDDVGNSVLPLLEVTLIQSA
jgi:hypothetical protein